MKLMILPERYVLDYQPLSNQKNILIRITSSEGQFSPLLYAESYEAIKEVKFDDITWEQKKRADESGESNLVPITDQVASQLLHFYKTHKDAQLLVVHCEAGISRSAAVAVGILRYLNESEREKEVWNDFSPNIEVVNAMLRQFTTEQCPFPEKKEKQVASFSLGDLWNENNEKPIKWFY